MIRRGWTALFALALGLALGLEIDPNQNPPKPLSIKGLKIHEWGVFLRGKAGGGGEPPSFVQRVVLPPMPVQAAPLPQRRPMAAKEPVLHVYAPKETRLKVRVGFPAGEPTFAWPAGAVSWEGCADKPAPSLSWDLRVKKPPPETGKEAAPLKVPEDHWMSAARKVGSDRIWSLNNTAQAEDFLFYEGELDAKACALVGVQNTDLGHTFRTDYADLAEAWLIEAGEKNAAPGFLCTHAAGLACPGDKPVIYRPERIQAADLKIQLAKALAAAGLTDKEAEALLTIWMPELTKPGRRLLYVLPRAVYDRLLPITFDPHPEELVRVGLVVQEVTP